MTGEEFLNRLNETPKTIGILSNELVSAINLSQIRIERLIKTINQLESAKEKIDYIKAVLKNPSNDNGTIYELLAYYWLFEHHVSFKLHPMLEKEECFKEKAVNYVADGQIENIVFDIKTFSFGLPRYNELSNRLNRMLKDKQNETVCDYIRPYSAKEKDKCIDISNQAQDVLGDYYITVSGKADLSSDFFEKILKDGCEKLLKSIFSQNPVNRDYFYKIDSIDIRAHYRKTRPTTLSIFDDDEWVENNQFQLLKHGSQFCRNNPFIIICAYDDYKCSRMLCSQMAFKTLCRRMFMLHTKLENRKLFEFDGKADRNISVAMAAKKLTGVLFIDVSDDDDDDDTIGNMMFINPNADNQLFNYQIDNNFRYNGVEIIDYKFDN